MATPNAHPAVMTIHPPFWPLVLLSTTLATTPSPRMTSSMVPSSSARNGGIGAGLGSGEATRVAAPCPCSLARVVSRPLHANPIEALPRGDEQRLRVGPAPPAEPHVRGLLGRRDVGQLLSGRRENVDAGLAARNGAIDVAVPVHADPIGPRVGREIHHRSEERR